MLCAFWWSIYHGPLRSNEPIELTGQTSFDRIPPIKYLSYCLQTFRVRDKQSNPSANYARCL
jgi:hypothetical protein